jgi:type IV secretion system protein VirB10
MRLAQGLVPVAILGGLAAAASGYAQASAQAPAQPATPAATASAALAIPATPAPASAPATKTYTVPAGTKVLLQLRSSVNTKSAKAGDGVYLASIFPVTVGNRVMIPEGIYVQGVVDRVQRGGRLKGKAQLDMHFTSMIFPNGSVVEIPGVVDELPGAKKQTVKDDKEGTIEQDGDKGRNAGETAKVAIPTGAGVGTIGGAVSGHPIEGGLAGLGAGLATVGLVSLFTRNADVDIPRGTQVEMVLQRPLFLQEENLSAAGSSGSPAALVPASTQPKPIPKPGRAQVLCPPEGLGCDE